MDDSVGIPPSGSDASWVDRGEYWLTNQPRPRIWSNQRRNLRAPLVLTGHGISLRVNHGALVRIPMMADGGSD